MITEQMFEIAQKAYMHALLVEAKPAEDCIRASLEAVIAAQPKPKVKLPQLWEFYDSSGSYYTDHSMHGIPFDESRIFDAGDEYFSAFDMLAALRAAGIEFEA